MITEPEPAPADADRLGLRLSLLAGVLNSALLAGAIAVFVSCVAFLIAGESPEKVLTWMALLGGLAFSGTFIGVTVGNAVASRR